MFRHICLVTAHAPAAPKQRPLGLERNRDHIEETVETEEELYRKMRSEDEVRISMDPLRGVCPTEEKSDVSRPIRSIKCAVVFNVLYKRCQCVVELCPAWPIWSRDLSPSAQGTRPPPLPGHWEFSLLAASKRINLDGVVDIHEQPNTESAATGQCMCILFFISHLVIQSFGTSPKWFVRITLILVIFFLGLINHIME